MVVLTFPWTTRIVHPCTSNALPRWLDIWPLLGWHQSAISVELPRQPQDMMAIAPGNKILLHPLHLRYVIVLMLGMEH